MLIQRFIVILFLFILPLVELSSQDRIGERFVQVSGIIVDDTNTPMSGVTIISQRLRRVALSEASGIYSLTSIPGDTILFRALGFKRYHSYIPEDFPDNDCVIDIVLQTDTIVIEEVTILPWRTYKEFIADVTQEKEEDPVIEFMNENLESIYVAIARKTDISVSPQSAYNTVVKQNYDNMRYRNQIPVNNLLNPFSWAKFFQGIGNGLFRNESSTVPKPAKVIEPKNQDQ